MPAAADPLLTDRSLWPAAGPDAAGDSAHLRRFAAAVGLGLGLVLCAGALAPRRWPAVAGLWSPVAVARPPATLWAFRPRHSAAKPFARAPASGDATTAATAALPSEGAPADLFAVGMDDIGAQVAAAGPDGTEPVEGWRERIDKAIALSRDVKGGNFVQIATVDALNRPRVRTVVFRGFLDQKRITSKPKRRARPERSALMLATDMRSDKVEELQRNNAMELVWWFSRTSEQFRVAGDVQLVGGEEPDEEMAAHRVAMWRKLTDKAREQFYWLSDKTQFRKTKATIPAGGRDEDGKILRPPGTFILVLLWPKRVDYLRLTDNFRQTDVIGRDNKWTSKPVFP